MSGCTWPLAGRLEGRTCGRDLVSPRSSFCAAHHNLNRETTMGRRDEEDELDEDLDEAEELEDDEDEPAPRKKAPRAKAAPAKAAKRPTPEETRALDLRIFDAADRLEAKLGRAPTLPEIADAAKVPGSSADARRMRVGKALRRRGLLTAATPAKAKATKAAKPKLEAEGPRPGDKGWSHRLAPPVIIARPVVAPTLIEALALERARLLGIVARLDATIADLGGAS